MRAIELLDRALALDDGNAEALKLVAQLDRAARLRTVLRSSFALLGVLLAVVAWVVYAPKSGAVSTRPVLRAAAQRRARAPRAVRRRRLPSSRFSAAAPRSPLPRPLPRRAQAAAAASAAKPPAAPSSDAERTRPSSAPVTTGARRSGDDAAARAAPAHGRVRSLARQRGDLGRWRGAAPLRALVPHGRASAGHAPLQLHRGPQLL